MNTPTSLTISDPLAAQDVTIVITLPAGPAPRQERPALVSIGSDGQAPLFKQGILAEIDALIQEAWTAFGLRQELRAAQAQAALAGEPETVIASATTDETNVATPVATSVTAAAIEAEDGDNAVAPARPSAKAPPRPPKPRNLSLF